MTVDSRIGGEVKESDLGTDPAALVRTKFPGQFDKMPVRTDEAENKSSIRMDGNTNPDFQRLRFVENLDPLGRTDNEFRRTGRAAEPDEVRARSADNRESGDRAIGSSGKIQNRLHGERSRWELLPEEPGIARDVG